MKPVEYRGGCLVDFPQRLTRAKTLVTPIRAAGIDTNGNRKDPWSLTDMLKPAGASSIVPLVDALYFKPWRPSYLGRLPCKAFSKNYRTGEFSGRRTRR